MDNTLLTIVPTGPTNERARVTRSGPYAVSWSELQCLRERCQCKD